MKDNISNTFTIKENTLYLGNDTDYLNIFLVNEEYCFEAEIVNNSLDLISFINANEVLLPHKTLLTLGTGDRTNILNIKVNNSLDIHTICSELKLKTTKHTYNINIYVNYFYEICLGIERIYPQSELVNLRDIYINEHCLHISAESLDSATIKEAGIILYNRECNIFPIMCSNTNDNVASFNIDLSQLILDKNSIFNGNLILNGKILPLNLNSSIYFKDNLLSVKGVTNSFTISRNQQENLIIQVENKIDIDPVFDNFHLSEDQFIATGFMNSNLELNNRDLFALKLKLTDGKTELLYDIEYDEDSFKIIFSKEDLFQLNNSFFNDIQTYIIISTKDKSMNVLEGIRYQGELTKASTSLCKGFKFSKEAGHLIGHTTDSSGSSICLKISSKKYEPLKIKIENLINIKEVSYLRVSKDSLQIKFKTEESIENFKFSIELESKLKTIKAHKLKILGKKTFIAYFKNSEETSFKGEEKFLFIDDVINNGVNVKTIINSKEYTQFISDINELSAYKNTAEFIRSTRKYKKLCLKAYKKLFLKLPINKKRVLFESFLGRNVSGNPKYIYQYLVDNNLDNEFELIWILNDTSEPIEGKHKTVKRKSLKYYYLMATSGYWIFNSRQAKEIYKRDDITYVQTWHGTPLKKLAGDMESVNMGKNRNIDSYKKEFFKESAKWDYLFAQNDFAAETLSRAFQFKKEIIEGYPANDILYTKNNEKDINELKDKLGLPKDKKIILYAPTWRDNQYFKKGHYKFELQLELEKMQEALGNEYIVLLRTHYLIANSINTEDYNGFVYNFSRGFDIQELYLVSDLLITDYSSVMFDYANLKRPMIFFTYDLEEYRDNLRGFYFDIEENLPGPIALTTDDIINVISDLNATVTKYQAKYEEFYNKFCHIDDGTSSKNSVNKIFKNLETSPGGNNTNEDN